MGRRFAARASAVLLLLVAHGAALAQVATPTPVGTTIRNSATVSYLGAGGAPMTITSNQVSATVTPPPSISASALLRVVASGSGTSSTAGPTQCRATSGTVTLAPPALSNGTVVDPTQPLPLSSTSSLHGGEAAFVQIADADQNLDDAALDSAEVTLTTPAGDSERLLLTETGPATGVFVGYVQTRAASVSVGNCVLEVERNGEILSIYTDPRDGADTSRATALVDPYGLVFDSLTGAAVNGARVRLIDAATGAPAVVFGDDGISSYPAEMVTGSPVTDSGGTVYTLPDGVFRYPLVAPGNYRIEVDPPIGHAFPTSRTVSELAQTPGGPYRLNAGSFGNAFAVDTPPAVAVDVPVDSAATQLFMQKSTTTTVAAIGDFVQYTLSIQNTSSTVATASVRTVDTLPAGLRYRAGSTRVDGAHAPDPEIGPDGQALTFVTGPLAPGQRRELRYVVEVTAGAHGKQLVNAAQSFGPDGLASNAAQVAIQLREELFRERAILMGRVVSGSCAAAASSLEGVGGVRVYLEDGRYSLTDDEGKYHFEDVAPGTHVVQMDTATIPDTHQVVTCHDRVRNAGTGYSQFVDVRGGALWRTDFVIAPRPLPKGLVSLQLDTALSSATGLKHSLTLDVEKLALSRARIQVVLPEGLSYRKGTAQLDGLGASDPRIDDTVLTFDLGELAVDRKSLLTFETEAATGSSGTLALKAVATVDTPAKPGNRLAAVENVILRGEMLYETASYRFTPRFDVLDVAIQAGDRDQLDRIVAEWKGVSHLRLSAVGHSDQLLIAARSRMLYPDNHALSRARAQVVADYLAQRLKIDPARVAVEGRGADEPLSSGRDPKSLALNRRVDIAIEGLRVVAAGGLTVRKGSDRSAALETVGVLGSKAAAAQAAAIEKSAAQAPSAAALDVNSLQPGVAWLLPAADDLPNIPSVKVAIQHAPDQRIDLLSNGAAVDALHFDGATENDARTVAVSRWRAVGLRDGENQLVAIVRNGNGDEVQRLTRVVRYSGGAVRAEVVREASVLAADGRTRPVIALRMIDASGQPARPGTIGGYEIDPPYRSWWEVQSMDDNKMVVMGTRSPTFSVGEDGLARVELEPTTQAGTATLRFKFNERREQEVRVWLEPQAREWILVGLAEGTTAYNTISQNMQAAADAGFEEGYSDDQGRVAFFAKGTIKGQYLLTAAYDSAREHELEKDKLLGAVEPDRFYTLYGDATEQRYEAATSRKLFVKLERRQFAALFGDFETGLTVTELSRYSRTFTGLKADYAGDRFGYSAFAAESEQGYVKDELRGDGTSGLYRLSRNPLIVNSDKIRLEIRDRFRSEVVVESRPLTRYIDYSIDYLNGTLFFKQPVPSRDASFNPVYIIAEYEILNGGEQQLTAGGRASVKLAGDKVELGASFVQEGAAAGDTRVAGTDLRWRIGDATELRAEVARSESDDPALTDRADAYLTELSHVSDDVEARAYVREQQAGFGVGQQLSTEGGTRKVGVDGRYRIAPTWAVEGEAYRQEVLDTGAQRALATAELRHEQEDYTLGAGARHVADTGLSGGDTKSEQAFVTGSLDLFKDLITLRASQDFSLGGSSSSIDFPARSLVGVDYHWRSDTTFFAEYEHANGDALESDMTRVGVRTTPWERAQLQSSMSQQTTEYGPRVFANFGLTQGWQATERWSFDLGLDQSKTVAGPAAQPFNANVPLASGSLKPQSDFLATFVGAMYRNELWTFTSRLENRTSDQEDRRIASGGLYREPRSGHAFAMSLQWFDSEFEDGSEASASDVQLGWAYRPAESDWIVLNRLDLKQESRDDRFGVAESSRAVNNLNANWQLDPNTQLGVQFGGRYVRSTFDGERYQGWSGLSGIDFRRDLTSRFDIGAHGTMLQSFGSDVRDHAVGVDLGFTLARNVWISIGYNFAGFLDDDFEASRYTAQGPYLKFRMKADQDTFRDLPGFRGSN
jgi:uncharacterized repeat protein (TIGR01451 family)